MRIPEVIKERKSIRLYEERDLPEGAAELLAEAACWAPSAGNLQPWEFIIVRSEEGKSRLAAAARQRFVAEAPAVFVVFANPARSAARYGARGSTLYCLQDTAAAVQNILLAAAANGLGGCWVGAFDEEEAARAVGAPPGLRPVAIVPVGYPAESPRPRTRRPLSEVVHYEGW